VLNQVTSSEDVLGYR